MFLQKSVKGWSVDEWLQIFAFLKSADFVFVDFELLFYEMF